MANQVLLELESAAQVMLVRNYFFVVAYLRLRFLSVGIQLNSRSPPLSVETTDLSQTIQMSNTIKWYWSVQ
jgi:hypothetical protein